MLHQEGRQIVIAGDKAPERLGNLEQRLVSRFAGGITAQLQTPEWETRVAILRQFAAKAGAKVPEEVLALVAMRIHADVRRLAGSLMKMIAYANAKGEAVSLRVAGDVLSQMGIDEAA